MNSDREEDYDMPLLERSSSLSPRSNSHLEGFARTVREGSYDETNIAAVSDDVEVLAFLEQKRNRSSSESSPVSIAEDPEFVAQFDPEIPEIMNIIDEKNQSAIVTVYDDNSSNDESLYHDAGDQNDGEAKSLAPPSIAGDETDDLKQKESTSNSNEGGSNSRLSSSTQDIDEDPNAAAWKADDIDAFVDAINFGQPTMEISGVDLLSERDISVNQLQEVNHLMTFNALVLIQKQKDWIEGSIDDTKGANKGSSAMITMELENLERKIKLLMDHKGFLNEKERKKQEADPFTPSKAFFKSMALIDKSIQQFHKGYLTHMSETSEENHELKERVDKLVEVNASLQEQADRSLKKTEIIRKLQKEREALTRKVDTFDQMLASLLINNGRENSSNEKHSSKIHSVKIYIQKLEMERNALQLEIQKLKASPNNTESDSDEDEHDAQAETIESTLTDFVSEGTKDSSPEAPSDSQVDEKDILNGDLGSKWHSLEQKWQEMSSKDDRIKSLSETVAGQESALAEVRAECKLMRMQLLQLETARNEYKAQCESKDSALVVSQDRISSLEEEILMAHAKCATYEEDYEALRESFTTQKVATNQEISNSQDDVKVQVEYIREEFSAKLKNSQSELEEVKEDRDRVIRDLKASVEEIKAERDNLKAMLKGNIISPIMTSHIEEKKFDDGMFIPGEVSPKSTIDVDFDDMRNRFVEKASQQAFTIAQLTEENEIKDEQLKSLHEMVEMLLGKRSGGGVPQEGGSRAWGKRISNLRSNVMNRRPLGGSMHGEVSN